MQKVSDMSQMTTGLINGLASDLLHPHLGRMSRDPAQYDASRLEMKEKEHVVGSQTSPCQHFHGEEVNPSENGHVRGNELLPSRALAPLRRWRDAITAQDIPHSLI